MCSEAGGRGGSRLAPWPRSRGSRRACALCIPRLCTDMSQPAPGAVLRCEHDTRDARVVFSRSRKINGPTGTVRAGSGAPLRARAPKLPA